MKKHLTIMLVDDGDGDRALFHHILQTIDPSLQYVTATDGEHGLDYLLTAEILPDYIFLDINMPRMSGMELLEKIKNIERLSHIPVIMYSTAQPWVYEQDAKRLGAVAALEKKMDFNESCHAIASVIFEHPELKDGEETEKGGNHQ
jgi:CheY-like chemotaxis protein